MSRFVESEGNPIGRVRSDRLLLQPPLHKIDVLAELVEIAGKPERQAKPRRGRLERFDFAAQMGSNSGIASLARLRLDGAQLPLAPQYLALDLPAIGGWRDAQ